jgi:hypothetical protein
MFHLLQLLPVYRFYVGLMFSFCIVLGSAMYFYILYIVVTTASHVDVCDRVTKLLNLIAE